MTYIVRLRPDGVRDRRFGSSNNGVVELNVDGYSLGIAAVVAERRIYVLVTTEDIRNGSAVVIARLRFDGRLDRGFGRRGFLHHRVFDMQPTDMALDHGMPVVSGWAGERCGGHEACMVLARFTREGEADHSFGRDGVVRTSIGNEAFGETVAVQRDGDILIGGVGEVGEERVAVLARYKGGGPRR